MATPITIDKIETQRDYNWISVYAHHNYSGSPGEGHSWHGEYRLNSGTWVTFPTSSDSVTIYNLSMGTTYTIGIRYICDGVYGPEKSVTVTTLQKVPDINRIVFPWTLEIDGVNYPNVSRNTNSFVFLIFQYADRDNDGRDEQGVTRTEFRLNGGSWIVCQDVWEPMVYTSKYTTLSPGTWYTVEARFKNSAGYSNIVSNRIRTKYADVTGTYTVTSGLDWARIDWSWPYPICDRNSANDVSIIYVKEPGASDYRFAGLFGTTPPLSYTFTTTKDENNRQLPTGQPLYIKIRALADDAHDRVNMIIEATLQTSTPYISSISSITIGDPFYVYYSSGDPVSIEMEITGNGQSFTRTYTSSGGSSKYISLSLSEWDDIYRRMFNNSSNSITAYFTMTATSNYSGKTYTDSRKSKSVVLTGKIPTAYVGVNTAPRRAYIWIGDSSGRARRAVGWVGVDGATRRTN